jgi:hypothetical protein
LQLLRWPNGGFFHKEDIQRRLIFGIHGRWTVMNVAQKKSPALFQNPSANTVWINETGGSAGQIIHDRPQ